MKCNWLGKIISENATIDQKWFLVVKPLNKIDDHMKDEYRRIVECTAHDANIRCRTGGFFVVRQGNDAHELGDIARKLKQIGFHPLLFNNAEFHDIPDIVTPNTGSVEQDEFMFESVGGGPKWQIKRGDILLVVKGRISTKVFSKDIRAYGTGGSIVSRDSAGISLSSVSTFSETKRQIFDIYNMNSNICIRIIESKFNFKDFLKKEYQYGPISNFNTLLEKLTTLSPGIDIDNSFDHSSLPHMDSSVTLNTTPSASTLTPGARSDASKDELLRFDQYSRFRYIVKDKFG